jgi:hypothetical protein
MDLYKLNILVRSSNPTLLRSSLVGGGDQGVLDERFAHPKPMERSCNPGAHVTREMAKEEVGTSSSVGEGNREDGGGEQHQEQGEATEWAMEVYKGTIENHNQGKEDGDEGILEFDLEEEATQEAPRLLAIAVFFSRKSFSPKFLFSDMLKAWNMKQLAVVEKIGDYIFRLEFITEAKKNRVLDGGLWCHKGDTLIVGHYDGLVRPSEIKITSLCMWLRFYDLPLAMMTEAVAMQLGGQLGKAITAD